MAGAGLVIVAILATMGCVSALEREALERPAGEALYVPPTTDRMGWALDRVRARLDGYGVSIWEGHPAMMAGAWGRSSPTTKTILMSSDLGPDAFFEVLLHEAAHLMQPPALSVSEAEVFAERVMVAVSRCYGHEASRTAAVYLALHKTGFATQKYLRVDFAYTVAALLGDDATLCGVQAP